MTDRPEHRTPERRPLSILSGVRILSFTSFLLGPAAVQYLGDLGADVIKIEPPGGGWERGWAGGDTFPGGVSAFYLLAHRNVRSVTLDLKNPQARTVTDRLVAGADVLVENFRPGVMERLGLGYDALSQANPRLVYASATGYGADSPYRDLPGQDLLLQSLTGLAAITGRAGEAPSPAGAPVVDQHGAALLAMGILAALLDREHTGRGQRIDVTMVQAALDLQVEPATYHLNGGFVKRPRENLASAFHQAPYGIYPTADGHIAVSLSPVAKVRAALGGAPGSAGLEDSAAGLQKRDEIYRALAPLLASRHTRELVATLRAGGVWCQAVQDYDAVFDDPIVRHLDPVVTIEHPAAGEFRTLRHPIHYGSGEPEVRNLGPAAGEHTDEVLAELGFQAGEIADLHARGCFGRERTDDDR